MKKHRGEYPMPMPEIPGWMSGAELEWLYQRAKEYRTIVEVGSAFGRSSHALLTGNYETFGKDGRVYCVDPWPLKDEVTKQFDHNRKDLNRRTWFILTCSCFPNLNILEVDSHRASMLFPLNGSVDMVFLDGGTDQIANDLLDWRDIPSKLLCGHDYSDEYPKVKRAVEAHALSPACRGVLEVVEGTTIWHEKRGQDASVL